DFDKTLTSCFVNGEKIVSLISILRDEKYLTPDYPEKAQALYDKYHPLETDPKIPLEEKKTLMHSWWSEHYELLVKSGLAKNDLARVAQSEKISLRPGAVEFMDFLRKNGIPLVILSAAGLGFEMIQMYLEKHGVSYDNIHIVSNVLKWDENGKAVGVQEPIIHTFNKNYETVKKLEFFSEVKARKNIVLLGDGEGDAAMIEGFEYDNIIKIGFLNEGVTVDLEKFKDSYDVLVLNDGPMDYVLKSFADLFDVVILDDAPMDFVNVLMRELVLTQN
ncbi:MAG: HAD-IB family phosphatase, partial [Candidatus Moranbacteria bacterium]|nr:HAD-IB family phosphatase [Candidatus Moranbacteria bacterium]